MKTKKLNRGLVLGAALLVGLAGYVTFDYFNFKSNKDDIKSAVESYLDEAAKASITQDGDCREALEKVISDNWGYNEFYDKSYVMSYTTGDDITSSLGGITDDEFKEGHVTDYTVSVSDLKVSKAGPNLAEAEANISIKIKGVGQAHILTPGGITNTIYDSDNFTRQDVKVDYGAKVFDEVEFSGTMNFEDAATFYLEYDKGTWKIVGSSAYVQSFELDDADGDALNLEKLSRGDTSKDDVPDAVDAGKGGVKIKLPDGTVIDVPEGQEIPKDLPDGVEIIPGSEADYAKADDSKASDSTDSTGGELDD